MLNSHMKKKKMQFESDKVTVRGPRIDGTIVVSFEVGEYQAAQAAALLTIGQGNIIHVTINLDEK